MSEHKAAEPVRTKEPEIIKLFPTEVIVTQIEDSAALNEDLQKVILDNMATSTGINRSNLLGWHSDTQMLKWGGEAVHKLALTMLMTCGRHTHDIGMHDNQPRFEMGIDMWANVSPAGASNQFHAHAGALWSGVYYVDDGGDRDEGKLVLLDPRFPMNRMYAPDLVFNDEAGPRRESNYKIDPVPGRLVIFPSWLNHAVRPHNGPGDRISIAMNVTAFPVRPGA